MPRLNLYHQSDDYNNDGELTLHLKDYKQIGDNNSYNCYKLSFYFSECYYKYGVLSFFLTLTNKRADINVLDGAFIKSISKIKATWGIMTYDEYYIIELSNKMKYKLCSHLLNFKHDIIKNIKLLENPIHYYRK